MLTDTAVGEVLDQHIEAMPVRCPHTSTIAWNQNMRCERNHGHHGPHRFNAAWDTK